MFISRIRRFLPSRHLVITFGIMNTLMVMLYVKMGEMYKFQPLGVDEMDTMHNGGVTESITSSNASRVVTMWDPLNITSVDVISYEQNETSGNLTVTINPADDTQTDVRQHLSDNYIHEPNWNCKDANMFIIYVFSHPTNINKRDLIRQTWGDLSRYKGYKDLQFKLLFVMGRRLDYQPAELRSEVNTYGDLLVADFLDTYDNLTLKGLVALRWIQNNCNIKDIQFVFKTDDDVFVNFYRLLEHVSDVLDTNGSHFLCRLNRKTPVLRTGRWAVSPMLYPGNVYPTYCSGGGYGMTRRALRLVLDSCFTAQLFPMEDFFFTSYCITQKYPGIELSHTRMSQLRCPMTIEYIEQILSRDHLVGVADLILAHPLPPQYWVEAYDIIERSL